MRIEHAQGMGYIVWGGEYGRTKAGTLVQTDWDYPSVAQALGWSLQRVQRRGGGIVRLARAGRSHGDCAHAGTDGTIPCAECGIAAGQFIGAAREYLDRRAG